MKNLLYILPLGIAFAITSCGTPDKKAELEDLKKQQSEIKEKIATLEAELSKSGDQKKVAGRDVAITTVEPAPFSHLIEVQAKVEGDENVMVSPETPGTISRIFVKVGDQVSPGSVLAELENSVYMKTLAELESTRDFTNTIYLKQKALWDQKIGTEIQFLQAKNSLESIDRKMATVRQQLEMLRIKSPIRGTVDAMDLKVGQAFAPGLPGLRVVNFSKLKIQADVAEAYISKVKKGDFVEVYFPDLKSSVKASISYAGKVIDPINRTFRVEVNINSNTASLHPNQVAIVRIADYTSSNAFTLPLAIVQNTPEGSYLFLAENGVAKKQLVKPGLNYAGKLEVLEGLKAGDKVITSGYQDLVDGQKINL